MQNTMNEVQTRIEQIINNLKKHNHRITPQRLAIIKILAKSVDHPSVESIYEQVKRNFPTTSLATVYQTVSLIKELGEVLELGFSDCSNRYDGNKPYPHPHVVCIKCKKIIDSELDNLQDTTNEIIQKTKFEIINHRMDFFGVCPECQEKEN
jgi:Fur family transcriptional regulator, peroxide stress response regulator